MTTMIRADAALCTLGDPYVVEASDLRIKPGEWPEAIRLQGHTRAVVYWRTQRTIVAGPASEPEFGGYIYDSGDPSLPQLHVLND